MLTGGLGARVAAGAEAASHAPRVISQVRFGALAITEAVIGFRSGGAQGWRSLGSSRHPRAFQIGPPRLLDSLASPFRSDKCIGFRPKGVQALCVYILAKAAINLLISLTRHPQLIQRAACQLNIIMKLTFPTTILFASLAAAAPHNPEPSGHEYRPEGRGDSQSPLPAAAPRNRKTNSVVLPGRSPCPGLNVLANHGWLPRSGKNISLADVRHATGHAFNYKPDVFDEAVGGVLAGKLSTTEMPDSTFNLDDLASAAAHGIVEFDGSLSRNDVLVSGDALHFDRDVWGPVARDLGLGEGGKRGVVTVEAAAKARAAREVAARGANPDFEDSDLQSNGSPGTTGLYLTTLWDENKGGAPKAWVKAFFGEWCRCPTRFLGAC